MFNAWGFLMVGDNVSHNNITGDKIITKPSKAYEDSYDAIFRNVKQRAMSLMGYSSLSDMFAHLQQIEKRENGN